MNRPGLGTIPQTGRRAAPGAGSAGAQLAWSDDVSAGLARAAGEGAGAGDAGFVVGRHSAPRVASGNGNTLQPVSGRSAGIND